MKNVKERDEESQTEVIEGLTYQDLLNNVDEKFSPSRLNREFVEKHLGNRKSVYEQFIQDHDWTKHEDTDHLRVFMSILKGELDHIMYTQEYLLEFQHDNLINLIQDFERVSMESFEELS